MRARALGENMRHQKKLEEFLKAVNENSTEEEIRSKFRDTLVKNGCLLEWDEIFNMYLEAIHKIAESKKR